jgi:predicted nuclease of predicted toxin-antitoxin system
VKLLFDENLSYRLIAQVAAIFAGSEHVDSIGLHGSADVDIWNFPRANDFTVITKDDDFRQRSFLSGHPSKVIWLSIGNAGTPLIARILVDRGSLIESFACDPDESLLVLELPPD